MTRLRIQITRDLEVELCEPTGADEQEVVSQAKFAMVSQCNCHRVAFRYNGDARGPWVDCVCGHRFNVNTNWIGNAA